MTGMAVLLAIAVMGIGTLAVTGRDHPPTWGGRFWSIYIEMSGRDAAGGGFSQMTRPEGEIHARLLLVAIIPLLGLIFLLAVAMTCP